MPTPLPILCVTVALFGLAFGSFLNVCIARLPRGESIISPRSHCPKCNRPLRWYDNIPVLSFLLLRGRCRNCRAPISLIYPAVELLTTAVLVVAFARYRLSPEFIKHSVLGMLLIVLVFTDLTHRRIPHPVTLLGMALGLLLSLIIPVDSRPVDWILQRLGSELSFPFSSLVASLAGAAVGGGIFYAVAEVFFRLTGKEGLGFGDVMLMLMVGTFLGVPLTLLTILLGSILGTLVAVPLELLSSRFRHHPWPFGTFLGLAAIYASLGGQPLLEAYLRWAGLAG
ncbi:MAG: prepilin peptidase [Acidobacteriia bacterium]|nr:prepilin peptidase [Terriglobia bacterium]